ncbi:MAG TPA: hypothetical protein VIW03_01715 [Anaeromyxobacter sp.]
MGLDWNPMARPAPGAEAEFERLVTEIDAGAVPRAGLPGRLLGPRRLSKAEKDARVERFRAITETPYASLGAPRVGFDAAADAWLRAKLEANGKLAELERARREMHGFYVLDLLPPCDGFPLYTNYGAYEGLDRYSFRAQFLDDAKEIIGRELHEQAWNKMFARQLAAYADALEAKARPWAERAGVIGMETATEAPELGEHAPASQAHVLFSAIRWCRFWAAHGHGLEPWF